MVIKFFLFLRQSLWDNNEQVPVFLNGALKLITSLLKASVFMDLHFSHKGFILLQFIIFGIIKRVKFQMLDSELIETLHSFFNASLFGNHRVIYQDFLDSFIKEFESIVDSYIKESMLCSDLSSYKLICSKYLLILDVFCLDWYAKYIELDLIYFRKYTKTQKIRSALDITHKSIQAVFVVVISIRAHLNKILKDF